MSKAKTLPSAWSELFTLSLYKRNQGRIARQMTAAAMVLIVGLGAYTWSQSWLLAQTYLVRMGCSWGVFLVGTWFVFRLINHPPFADFLISVEGEMDKVSWASKHELYRATIVVITMMFFLGAILYAYDLIWYQILSLLRVLRI